MSSVRESYKPHVLPFLLIWHENLSTFEKLASDETDPDVKEYLYCLLTYRKTLGDNHPRDNNTGVTDPEITALLKQISALNDRIDANEYEFKAAIYNLQGLILRDIHRYKEAIQSFEKFYDPFLKDNLQLITRATLLSHVGATLQSQNKMHMAAKRLVDCPVVKRLDMDSADNETRQMVAAIYLRSAYFCRKYYSSDLEISEKRYDAALDLWPENIVIANCSGALLSKMSKTDKLEKGDAILAKFHDKAVKENLFVTLYYRADINMKLAAFYKADNEKFLAHTKLAADCLALAETALAENTTYTCYYKTKSSAKMKNLASNLGRVKDDPIENVVKLQKESIDLRDQIEESEESRQKFLDKLVDPVAAFNPYKLFRRPVIVTEAVAELRDDVKKELRF